MPDVSRFICHRHVHDMRGRNLTALNRFGELKLITCGFPETELVQRTTSGLRKEKLRLSLRHLGHLHSKP